MFDRVDRDRRLAALSACNRDFYAWLRNEATFVVRGAESMLLIDRIYEAAFVPEMWPRVLDEIGSATGSASGAILVFAGRHEPPRYRTTALTQNSLERFSQSKQWTKSERVPHLFNRAVPGLFSRFIYLADHLTDERLERDSVQSVLTGLGLEAQITTVIPMPSGEVVSFTLERWKQDGRHSRGDIAMLDAMRPHLARAGLMAARLGLERARGTVSAMEAIGLPAAVLMASGRVLAANALLEALPSIFIPRAHGHMALANDRANLMYLAALSEMPAQAVVRSFPMQGDGERAAFVVHMLPLRRSAHDLFAGDVLLAATTVGHASTGPEPQILIGLFDLTAAEARLAAALADGKPLKACAADLGIAFSTARSYLERVFRKTGTRQQSQLVKLLAAAQPFLEGRQ